MLIAKPLDLGFPQFHTGTHAILYWLVVFIAFSIQSVSNSLPLYRHCHCRSWSIHNLVASILLISKAKLIMIAYDNMHTHTYIYVRICVCDNDYNGMNQIIISPYFKSSSAPNGPEGRPKTRPVRIASVRAPVPPTPPPGRQLVN